MISYRLLYRPVTVSGSYYTPLPYRYLTLPTVTDRPPLPHRYGPLQFLTVTSNDRSRSVTVRNGQEWSGMVMNSQERAGMIRNGNDE